MAVTEGSPVPLPPRRPMIRPAGDRFADVANSMDHLRVDGADLAAMGEYLDKVAQLSRIIHQLVHAADRAAQTDDTPGHRYGSLGAAEIEGVAAVTARLTSVTSTVQDNLTRFATAVDHTAEALVEIGRRYRDADERNQLNADQVRKYLKS